MGFFDRISQGLQRSRDKFKEEMNVLLDRGPDLDEEFWDGLEETLILADIGGAAAWMVYLLCGALGCDVYAANLFAAVFAALYAEIMARVRKCPATPYLVIATIPMLPGAGVYYTMSLGLEGSMMASVAKGLQTIGIAGSLAVGILLVSTVFRLIGRRSERSGRG